MKLSFSRFLVENIGETPNISPIKNNLMSCINNNRFIFRGSDTTPHNFGEKDARKSRSSLTNSNIILNFSSLYFDHLPNRKQSYFGTNSPSNATEFGEVYVIIPHDSTERVAVVPNDFNLRDNPVLNEIKSGLDFSGFGFQFIYSIQKINSYVKTDLSKKLDDIATKISNEHEGISKDDFQKFDEAFNEFFSSGEIAKVHDPYYDIMFASYVWEVVSSKYDGSLIRFLKHAVKEGTDDIKVLPFAEALKEIKEDETYEIWFQGKCSYFSLNWLNKEHKKNYGDENLDIINDANSEDDINSAIAEIFKKFI